MPAERIANSVATAGISFVLICGQGASAQTGSDQQLRPVQVEGRRDPSTMRLDEPAGPTSSRLGITVRETPGSVEVIDQQAIRERGKRTVMEALEGGTGLSIGRPGGSPGLVVSRGFVDSSVRYLYDGVPLIDAGMVTRPNGTFNIDRIEILRGPASVLHGTQGLGGAVNFVSKAPSRTQEPIDVEAGVGNYRSWRLGAGTGGPIGKSGLAYRFDASTTRFDTFQPGNRHEYDRVTGTLAYDIAPRMTVSLQVDWLRDDQQDSYWGTPLNNGRIDRSLRYVNYNNLTDNIFSGETTWIRNVFDWKASDSFELRNNLYYYDSFRNWRNSEIYSFNPAAGTVTRSSFGDLDHDHQMFGDRLDALYKHKIAGRDNRVAFGFEINRTEFVSNRNGFPGSQTFNAYNPPAVSFFSVAGVIPKFKARDVTIDQWGLFVEDQFAVTRAFKLVGGLRYDNIDASFVRTDAGTAQVAPIPYQKKWTPVGTRVGFVFDALPNLTWYGVFNQGTEPVGTLLLLAQTNINFELTKGRMVETGLKGDFWGKRGDWSAAAYQIVKKNVLIPITPAITEQAGQQSSRGLELSVGVRPSNVLKVEANAAVLKAKFDTFNENVGGTIVSRAGNRPQNIPEQVFNLGMRYAVVPNVETSAWVRHVGKRYNDTANQIEQPAYTVLDLSVGYKFARRMGVEFWLRNATNKLYAEWRGASNNQVILGAPRTVEVVFRGQF